jgi:Patatin-like phospholipase
MSQLRLSLTISGAVSLGSYEGGALAALLYAVRKLAADDNPALRIDVMSGASAGSITALLAARALQQGHDPCTVMSGAWVKDVSIGSLLAHDARAPLSIDALRKLACDLLDPAQGAPSAYRQAFPIRMSYTLACLRGLEYRLPRLGRAPLLASTFVDTFEHTLTQGDTIDSLLGPQGASPLDAALASAANELGFPPYLLDRSRQWPVYLQEGVDNLPPDPSRSLWYTDGGTIDNEPLGHTLDITNDVDGDNTPSQRLHLLIHPHPTAAIHDLSWANPQVQPTFVQTAVRGLEMQRTQSLYADLKQVEKTNSHIAWIEILHRELGAALDQLPDESRAQVAGALSNALDAMAKDVDALHEQHSATPGEGSSHVADEPTSSPSALLSDALHQASGLAGKQTARVDVISPLLLPESETHSVDQLLSGEVLFHFGGFLDEGMRRNDFDLGYSSTIAWLTQGGLTSAGLPGSLAEEALASAADAYQPGKGWERTGSTTVGSLLAMHPWEAARLAGKITHVLLHDLIHHPRP